MVEFIFIPCFSLSHYYFFWEFCGQWSTFRPSIKHWQRPDSNVNLTNTQLDLTACDVLRRRWTWKIVNWWKNERAKNISYVKLISIRTWVAVQRVWAFQAVLIFHQELKKVRKEMNFQLHLLPRPIGHSLRNYWRCEKWNWPLTIHNLVTNKWTFPVLILNYGCFPNQGMQNQNQKNVDGENRYWEGRLCRCWGKLFDNLDVWLTRKNLVAWFDHTSLEISTY